MTGPRVVYWNNIPAPYMVDRFNAVAERGNLDFEAWFSARTESDRSWTVDESSWSFPYRYLPAFPSAHQLVFPAPLLHETPQVLVSLYAGPSFLLGSALARLKGSRTAYWVEVTFDAWVPRRRWKERLKSTILPRADGVLTAGRDGQRFAMRYGVSADRIFLVPHTVDAEYYAQTSAIARGSRDRIRAELGVRGVTFVYVGRLWSGKGLDHLLDAFAGIERTSSDDVTLLLVGDGSDEGRLRARCHDEGIRNVVFAGFHGAETLPRLYAAADVFVFPTLGDPFGMVVPEAMACGLPVITTSAAGEIGDRVLDGVNGFIVPPGDSAALRERMEALARDGDLRRRMGVSSARCVADQSSGAWAETFEDAIKKILAAPTTR